MALSFLRRNQIVNQIFDLLSGVMSSDNVQQISQQIGASPSQTQSAISAALPALLGGLQQQTKEPEQAQKLASALDRDHDGSLLDGIGGMLSGLSGGGDQSGPGLGGLLGMAGSMLAAAPGPGSNKTTDGDGILGHILGGKRPAVEQGMAKASGLDLSQVTKLLPLLAPLVMGALGKAKQAGGLDAGGLGDLLGGVMQQMGGNGGNAGSGAGGLLGGLLDSDGDGSIADDLAGMAAKNVLGGLFK